MNLHLLVVMRTTGYGQATAPAGWGGPQVCPAGWNEVKRKRRRSTIRITG